MGLQNTEDFDPRLEYGVNLKFVTSIYFSNELTECGVLIIELAPINSLRNKKNSYDKNIMKLMLKNT